MIEMEFNVGKIFKWQTSMENLADISKQNDQ